MFGFGKKNDPDETVRPEQVERLRKLEAEMRDACQLVDTPLEHEYRRADAAWSAALRNSTTAEKRAC